MEVGQGKDSAVSAARLRCGIHRGAWEGQVRGGAVYNYAARGDAARALLHGARRGADGVDQLRELPLDVGAERRAGAWGDRHWWRLEQVRGPGAQRVRHAAWGRRLHRPARRRGEAVPPPRTLR